MTKNYVINNEKLMKEWNWDKNNSIGLFPDKITCGSSIRAWWKCKNGHEWQTKVSHKNNGTKCKLCNSIQLSIAPKNKSLTELFPEIAKEWDYAKNNTTPDQIYPQSNKKYWWICSKGHEFEMSATHRTGRNGGCPICSNNQVVKGINDLMTTHPQLISEWDYEENNKIGMHPDEISYGSKKKVNWICKRGHKWQAVVYSRATNKRNCPYCNQELRSSFPEKAIAYYVHRLFKDAIENYKAQFLGKMELDVFIPSINTAIEYDGSKWHKDIQKDLFKDELCQRNQINLIRVRENECPHYQSQSTKIFVKGKDVKDLEKAIGQILTILQNHNKDIDIDIERDSEIILQNVLSVEKTNTILQSQIINEWDWEKNKNINPAFIPLYSNRKYWWKCKNGHEWYAAVSHRTNGRGCPYCAGQKLIQGFNDLESQFPEIAKEWDYSKNDTTPNKITARSNKKYWWICPKCNHSWQTAVYVRTGMKCGCPQCKKKALSLKSSKKVLNTTTGNIYDSIKIASNELNINPSSISNCCRGITQTAGGYHWKYLDK